MVTATGGGGEPAGGTAADLVLEDVAGDCVCDAAPAARVDIGIDVPGEGTDGNDVAAITACAFALGSCSAAAPGFDTAALGLREAASRDATANALPSGTLASRRQLPARISSKVMRDSSTGATPLSKPSFNAAV